MTVPWTVSWTAVARDMWPRRTAWPNAARRFSGWASVPPRCAKARVPGWSRYGWGFRSCIQMTVVRCARGASGVLHVGRGGPIPDLYGGLMARRTKIIATIGPAPEDAGTHRGLIRAGMDVARLGLAHYSIDEAAVAMARVPHLARASHHV